MSLSEDLLPFDPVLRRLPAVRDVVWSPAAGAEAAVELRFAWGERRFRVREVPGRVDRKSVV